MLISGAPMVANNRAIAEHNADNNKIYHSPDTAAQLHCSQFVSANLTGHINIGYGHANHSHLPENQRPGEGPKLLRTGHKTGVVIIVSRHGRHIKIVVYILG